MNLIGGSKRGDKKKKKKGGREKATLWSSRSKAYCAPVLRCAP